MAEQLGYLIVMPDGSLQEPESTSLLSSRVVYDMPDMPPPPPKDLRRKGAVGRWERWQQRHKTS